MKGSNREGVDGTAKNKKKKANDWEREVRQVFLQGVGQDFSDQQQG